jgi:all-trans-retinol dehydrogenase (NAD+)
MWLILVLILLLCLFKLKIAHQEKEIIARRKQELKEAGGAVLITGGAFGLGKELAIYFLKLGLTVIVADVREAPCPIPLEGEEGGNKGKSSPYPYHSFLCDVSDPEQIYSMADNIKNNLNLKVSILINNAGIVHGRPFLETTDKQLRRTFEVNTFAHFYTMRAFLPDMMAANQGHIVNVASIVSYMGIARIADYCASKAADRIFTEGVRHEIVVAGKDGVTVTTINPFMISTGMFEGIKYNTLLEPLLPHLTERDVVECVGDSICLKRNWDVEVPGYLSPIPLILRLIPVKLFFWLRTFSQMDTAMNCWKGRGGEWAMKCLSSKKVD